MCTGSQSRASKVDILHESKTMYTLATTRSMPQSVSCMFKRQIGFFFTTERLTCSVICKVSSTSAHSCSAWVARQAVCSSSRQSPLPCDQTGLGCCQCCRGSWWACTCNKTISCPKRMPAPFLLLSHITVDRCCSSIASLSPFPGALHSSMQVQHAPEQYCHALAVEAGSIGTGPEHAVVPTSPAPDPRQ